MTTESHSSLQTLTLGVTGMSCSSCVAHVEQALKGVTGVHSASVSLEAANATISYDGSVCSLDELRGAVESAGYEPR